ncbi:hypothetical protein Halha_1188 [Halobacteroides halobius DSM 5150]|uniref:Type III effector Hrp-dependent outer protein n=1 Tax=Halobacteroides halobius (strain ATCC 35273 / DSM 5150 / MD-1) TaxID=748449 RepID=L0K7Y6_HALHC|nr:four-carbon acid sugar kinase family protein [Halobacteroides halobius]AGB41136.1 hypothetical protein Halha_1188 [Halobacteroides halobius DSM 5150]
MANKLAVIADDFTGANDTGVQFSKAGLKTLVTSQLETIDQLDYKADVVVIDTNSRADQPATAYKKVAQATQQLQELGIDYIYKKLDSTLRGNIGAEIEGALVAGGYELAIVAPALPATDRTTIGGNQLVQGVPLEETEIAHDPVTPVNRSYIPDIIGEQTTKEVVAINLKDLLKGADYLVQLIEEKAESGAEIIVVDATTSKDLEIITATLNLLEADCLLVGSAGFAESLPVGLNLVTSEKEEVTKSKGSILGIAGSVSDITRGQVNYAQQELDNLSVIDIQLADVLQNNYQVELDRVISAVDKLITADQDIIIRSAKDNDLVAKAKQLGKKNGLTGIEVSNRIARFLGEVAKYFYVANKIEGIFLTGGDIAVKSAALIGAEATVIKDEILPGIPRGRFLGTDLPQIPVVTKAGAFGNEEALVEIIAELKRRN